MSPKSENPFIGPLDVVTNGVFIITDRCRVRNKNGQSTLKLMKLIGGKKNQKKTAFWGIDDILESRKRYGNFKCKAKWSKYEFH